MLVVAQQFSNPLVEILIFVYSDIMDLLQKCSITRTEVIKTWKQKLLLKLLVESYAMKHWQNTCTCKGLVFIEFLLALVLFCYISSWIPGSRLIFRYISELLCVVYE